VGKDNCRYTFAFFTLTEHMELTLSLEEKARRKAFAKTRRLRQNDPATTPSRQNSSWGG